MAALVLAYLVQVSQFLQLLPCFHVLHAACFPYLQTWLGSLIPNLAGVVLHSPLLSGRRWWFVNENTRCQPATTHYGSNPLHMQCQRVSGTRQCSRCCGP
jgi:hypothetical protein